MYWGRRSLGPEVVGHDESGVIPLRHSVLGQDVSGAVVVGHDVSGAIPPGAQCTGAGCQRGQWLWGTTLVGQSPWGTVYWGRMSEGSLVVGHVFVRHELSRVIPLGHSVLRQDIRGARGCGARRCGARRQWGNPIVLPQNIGHNVLGTRCSGAELWDSILYIICVFYILCRPNILCIMYILYTPYILCTPYIL